MATVTGLTADRMLEIEAASVVDGLIVGDDLVLTKHDGTPINAGNVRGPVGPVGPAGTTIPKLSAFPGSPVDGDVIARIDQVRDPLYKFSDGFWMPISQGPDIFDDFSSGLGKWTLLAGPSGTIVNAGGHLSSTAVDLHRWSPVVPMATDSAKAMIKFQLATASASQLWLSFCKYLDPNNLLQLAIWGTPGGLWQLGCWKWDSGIQTAVGSFTTGSSNIVSGQDYWAVFRQSGKSIHTELYDVDPTLGKETPIGVSTQALAGANLTKFGPGVANDWVIEFQPPSASASNYLDEATLVTIPSVRSQF